MTSPLIQLQELGQSPWHDNIRRGQLASGELARMVADGDITGLTSNPSIFEKAIAESEDYDEALRTLALAGKSAPEMFDQLAIEDIQAAADIFKPVYERTERADGYVSIEVSPEYAHDTQTTCSEAERLWDAVARPNLLVKIPATQAGLPAIAQSIASGINVNVTLIFSRERYSKVMDAYLDGMEQRAARGSDLTSLASVASFFVSRVDNLVDQLLDKSIAQQPAAAAQLSSLKGRAAIANARLAYEMFQEIVAGERWQKLADQGAQVQRPLWASTSTKNPDYSDVLYIESLIGPDTVNTMPPNTLQAFKDHGLVKLTVTENVNQSRQLMDQLAEINIDMQTVTQQLEEEGVASFFRSFENLLKVIENKRSHFPGVNGANQA